MRARRAVQLLLIPVILLVVARALLPIAIQRYVNRVLARDETYIGHVGDVDVALIRGAYTVRDVRVDKRSGKVPVPFFASDAVDLSIQWHALLFDRALVGEAEFQEPKLNFVLGPSVEQSQAGQGVDWRKTVEDLFPFRINRVAAHDGEIHFRSFHTKPPVNVYLHHVELVALNLTNAEGREGSRVARLTMRGIPMNAGMLRLSTSLDPFAKTHPDFDFAGEVTGADLTQWNDFLQAYGKFDVQRGTFSVYSELVGRGNRFDGYVKPFFGDVDVLDVKKDLPKGWLHTIWEAIVGATDEVFQDQSHDRVATRIPISGTVGDPKIGFWATLGNVVRNAFIESLVPRLEGKIGAR
jgi:Domain of Unknown Function (DUF748)